MDAKSDRFRELATHSEGIRQGAIGAAQAVVKQLTDEMPSLVKKEAGDNPTTAGLQAAQDRLAPMMTEAQLVRDKAIARAHQQHHDRLQAAAAHCGVTTDAPGNPGEAHAQAFIAMHAPKK